MTPLHAFRRHLPPDLRAMLLTRALGAWAYVRALTHLNACTGGLLPHEAGKKLEWGVLLGAGSLVLAALVLLGGH